jgi:hypothetical protein
MPKGESNSPGGEGDLVVFFPREKGTKLSFPKERGVGFSPRKSLALNCLFARRIELASPGTKLF